MNLKEVSNYTMVTFRVDTFKANGLESETNFVRLSIIDLARPLSIIKTHQQERKDKREF